MSSPLTVSQYVIPPILNKPDIDTFLQVRGRGPGRVCPADRQAHDGWRHRPRGRRSRRFRGGARGGRGAGGCGGNCGRGEADCAGGDVKAPSNLWRGVHRTCSTGISALGMWVKIQFYIRVSEFPRGCNPQPLFGPNLDSADWRSSVLGHYSAPLSLSGVARSGVPGCRSRGSASRCELPRAVTAASWGWGSRRGNVSSSLDVNLLIPARSS